MAIEIVRVLNHELSIPLGHAAALVRTSSTGGGFGPLRTNSGISIALPVQEIEQRIQAQLRDALEAAPQVPRGRPRKPITG